MALWRSLNPPTTSWSKNLQAKWKSWEWRTCTSGPWPRTFRTSMLEDPISLPSLSRCSKCLIRGCHRWMLLLLSKLQRCRRTCRIKSFLCKSIQTARPRSRLLLNLLMWILRRSLWLKSRKIRLSSSWDVRTSPWPLKRGGLSKSCLTSRSSMISWLRKESILIRLFCHKWRLKLISSNRRILYSIASV